jgi:hypothetical protein
MITDRTYQLTKTNSEACDGVTRLEANAKRRLRLLEQKRELDP